MRRTGRTAAKPPGDGRRPRGYLRRELASESQIECRFGAPIAADGRLPRLSGGRAGEEALESSSRSPAPTVLRFDARTARSSSTSTTGSRAEGARCCSRAGAAVPRPSLRRRRLVVLRAHDPRLPTTRGATRRRRDARLERRRRPPRGGSASASSRQDCRARRPRSPRHGISSAEPGSYRGDHPRGRGTIEAGSRAQLAGRGVEVGEPFRGRRAKQAGVHPDRAPYGSFLAFSDPDGNGWMVQEAPRGGG